MLDVNGSLGIIPWRRAASVDVLSLRAHGWVTMHDAKRSSFFHSWGKIAVVFPAHMSLSRRQRDYPQGNKTETRESSISPNNLVDVMKVTKLVIVWIAFLPSKYENVIESLFGTITYYCNIYYIANNAVKSLVMDIIIIIILKKIDRKIVVV